MLAGIDYEARYGSPGRVLADLVLQKEQKRAILEQWRLDEQRRMESRSEGMQGGEPDRLREVDRALQLLREA